jgi:hypothetical protein
MDNLAHWRKTGSSDTRQDNNYLNFIKKNHLKLLGTGHKRSLSKGEKPDAAGATIPAAVADNKTLTIEVQEQETEEVFPSSFRGRDFTDYRSQNSRCLLNAEKRVQVRLSNDDISTILEDKRRSVMKIVYESLQMSVGRKDPNPANANTRDLAELARTQIRG